MKVNVKSITGFEDAFIAMYLSKRTWTDELDKEIRGICDNVLDKNGNIKTATASVENITKFNKWLEMLLRIGKKHITLLRFIDISIMTEGLHRAGQDDIDAHARRFDNRIIRNSTRLATFGEDEMSDWYKNKIITTDKAAQLLNIELPCELYHEGNTYVKAPNGYIKKEYENSKDVRRGLYMLSIPSNFISKINLCEFGHVFKERNKDGGANPEVKEWAEAVTDGIYRFHNQITREYILNIEN